MTGWVLILTLAGGGVDYVGPFSSRSACEYARQEIMYVDRRVVAGHCEPNYDRERR